MELHIYYVITLIMEIQKYGDNHAIQIIIFTIKHYLILYLNLQILQKLNLLKFK